MKVSKLLPTICGSLLAFSNAFGEVVNLNAIKDNTLYQNPTGATSNGIGDSIFSGRTNQFSNNLRRALIAFDIDSQIPAGVTITNATLRLLCTQTISGPQDIELHRLTRDWGESTSNASGQEGQGGPAATGDATWIHAFRPSITWTTAGGDFSSIVSAVTSVDSAGEFYSWSSAQLIADVQNWLDNPSTDFGWLLRGNEVIPTSAKRFASRENLDPDARPVLIVEYTPEPATAGLFMLGIAPILLRRKRH